jgi:hypothetical protein
MSGFPFTPHRFRRPEPRPSSPRLHLGVLAAVVALLVAGAAPASARLPDLSPLAGAVALSRSGATELVPHDADGPAIGDAGRRDQAGMPEIVFPVVGPVTYTDTWGACRGVGCSRTHNGVDLFGHKLAPLVAADDGEITFVRESGLTLSGNAIVIEADDGWRYLYLHLNNDAPGTDDGSNPQAWIRPNRLRVGDRVVAGQIIGYLGDSGNAEDTPAHLHFEVHEPGGDAINPTPLVDAADRDERRVRIAALASTADGRSRWTDTVTGQYRALLEREPTAEELFAWTDRFDIGFATEDDLIADLTMSRSRRDRAGATIRAFQVTLDRLPTALELDAWEGAVERGFEGAAMTEVMLESDAFIRTHGPLSDAEFIGVLYANAIDQTPSEERLEHWLSRLDEGMTRAELAAHWADSYAVKDRTWHGLEVVQAYRGAHNRMPDAAEYDRWLAHLDAGGLVADVVAVIRNSTPDEDGEPPQEPEPGPEVQDD